MIIGIFQGSWLLIYQTLLYGYDDFAAIFSKFILQLSLGIGI